MPVGPDEALALSPIIEAIGGPSVNELGRSSTLDSAVKSTIDIFFGLSSPKEVLVITSDIIDVSLVNETRF